MPNKISLFDTQLDDLAQYRAGAELGLINEDMLNILSTYLTSINLIVQETHPEVWDLENTQPEEPTFAQKVEKTQVPSALIATYNKHAEAFIEATHALQDTREDTISSMRLKLSDYIKIREDYQRSKAAIERYTERFGNVGNLFFGMNEPDSLDYLNISDEDLNRLMVSCDGAVVDGGYIAKALQYYSLLQNTHDQQAEPSDAIANHIANQIALLTKYQHIFSGILMQRAFITENNGKRSYVLDKANIAAHLAGKEIFPNKKYDVDPIRAMQAMDIHAYPTFTQDKSVKLKNAVSMFSNEMRLIKVRRSFMAQIKSFFNAIISFFQASNEFDKVKTMEEYHNASKQLLKELDSSDNEKTLPELIALFMTEFSMRMQLNKIKPAVKIAYAADFSGMAMDNFKKAEKLICEKINKLCIEGNDEAIIRTLTPEQYDTLLKIQIVYTLKEQKDADKYKAFLNKSGIAYQIIHQGLFEEAPMHATDTQKLALKELGRIIRGEKTDLEKYQDRDKIRDLVLLLASLYPEQTHDAHVNKNKGAALLEAVLYKFVLPRIYNFETDAKEYQDLIRYIQERGRVSRVTGKESYRATKEKIYQGVGYDVARIPQAQAYYQKNKPQYDAIVGRYDSTGDINTDLAQLSEIHRQLGKGSHLNEDLQVLVQDFLNTELATLKILYIDTEKKFSDKVSHYLRFSALMSHDVDKVLSNDLKDDMEHSKKELLMSARTLLTEAKDPIHLTDEEKLASKFIDEFGASSVAGLIIHEDYSALPMRDVNPKISTHQLKS